MTRFKFRIWDRQRNRMLSPAATECQISLCGFEHQPDVFPLMQFTGLHDKTGREIFEGDVLQPINMHTPDHPPFVVRWNENKAAFECTDGRICMIPADCWCLREVIGNIYEHEQFQPSGAKTE